MAAVAVSVSGAASAKDDRPTYVFPDKNIVVIMKAFEKVGYQRLKPHALDNWTVVEDSDAWTICWSWRFAQFRHFKALTSEHRINHLPGTYSMLMKSMLYSTLLEMQNEHGKEQFKLMAAQYVLPQDVDEFKKAYDASKDRPVPARLKERAASDPMYRKRWLVKAQTHRGIHFFSGMHELPSILHNHSMVAEYIEPLLIGGYKFDMALYVAVTSIDPLRIYIYDVPKIRFCKLKYPNILDERAKELSYIVTQIYMPTWQNPALKEYYTTGLPSVTQYPNDMEIIKSWMADNELDGEHFEREMYGNIIKIVSANRHKFLAGLDYNMQKWEDFKADASNFFEMWRFDFVVDDEGRTYITEANQSPNMVVYNFTDGTTDLILKQGVIQDLLSMVVAGSQPLPELPEMDDDWCDEHCGNKKRSRWNVACWSCDDWFDEEERVALHRAALEFSNRGNYRLVYPEITPLGQHPPFHTFLEDESEEDVAVRQYFASLESLKLSQSDGAPMVCYDRVQCNDHGNCVEGKCACDSGYEGTICNKLNPKLTAASSSGADSNSLVNLQQLFGGGDSVRLGVLVFAVVCGLVGIARSRRVRQLLFRRQKSGLRKTH